MYVTMRYGDTDRRIACDEKKEGKRTVSARLDDEGHQLRYRPPERENQPRLRWSALRGVLPNSPPPRGRCVVYTG